MGVLDALRKASSTGLYECRHCGEKFVEEVDECPACGSQEIAHYEF